MEVCVPKELKWSEQVKKVWTDQYLCGIKANTWLTLQGCWGWGHHGCSLGTRMEGDCSTAASRKKGKSAECLEEHDLRCAGIRIAEQFLVSTGRAAALCLFANSFPKPLLPSHCRSQCWSFSVGTRQVGTTPHSLVYSLQECGGDWGSRAEEPLPPHAAGDKRPQQQT